MTALLDKGFTCIFLETDEPRSSVKKTAENLPEIAVRVG